MFFFTSMEEDDSDLPISTPIPPPDSTTVPLLSSQLTPLDASLRRLQTFVTFVGLYPISPYLHPLLLPSIFFLILGVVLPVVSTYLSWCFELESTAECAKYRVEGFEISVLVSYSAAAGVSLACVTRSLGKYGIKRFLFTDQRYGRSDSRLQQEYLSNVQGYFRMEIWWILPCVIIKLTREIFLFMHLLNQSVWRSVLVFMTSMISWTYLTCLLLSSCQLFHLVCQLQVIHIDDYAKLLEQDMDPLLYVEEHINLRFNLSKISHRFRMFLFLLFSFVTVSLFVILFQTTAYKGSINFINGGNITVSVVVQVIGLVVCLHGAAKISHRAQGIASLASRWHALVTCSQSSNNELPILSRPSTANLSMFSASLMMDYSEQDLESLDSIHGPSQWVSHMSSYHKREALTLYLLSNPGGITLFGWIIDRTFLNTAFVLELTLVLFVLGKTIVIPET